MIKIITIVALVTATLTTWGIYFLNHREHGFTLVKEKCFYSPRGGVYKVVQDLTNNVYIITDIGNNTYYFSPKEVQIGVTCPF